jgi:hypothetical protein
MRREMWLRVTPEFTVQMAVVSVKDGMVTVDENSLSALSEGRIEDVSAGPTWRITHELMTELLKIQGFRLWEEMQ